MCVLDIYKCGTNKFYFLIYTLPISNPPVMSCMCTYISHVCMMYFFINFHGSPISIMR